LGFSIKAERSGCVVEALRAESFLVNQVGGIILMSQKERKIKDGGFIHTKLQSTWDGTSFGDHHKISTD
jgi:hypothetical protein